MNSGLIKMQFFIMLLYFHRKNGINKIASQVSFKLFVKFFNNSCSVELLSEPYLEPSRKSAMELFLRKQLTSYFRKKAPSQMFECILIKSLPLDGCYLHGHSRSMYILLFQNVTNMQLQGYNIVEDRNISLKIAIYFMTEVFIIQKPVHWYSWTGLKSMD